jgi:hypothetical protein
MSINFLENLEVDVRYPLGNRYFLKRYTGNQNDRTKFKGNWVDPQGKIITEPLYSFIIEHGNKWDNSTNFNVVESQLDTTMDIAMEHLNRIKTERKELLIRERSERKLYPQLVQWKFENVTISVVSKMLYTNYGYPLVGKKEVTIYGNGMMFEYSNRELDKDFEITYEWIMDMVINRRVLRHNVNNMTKWFDKGVFAKKVKHTKIKKQFLPLHFYIGYCVEVDGKPFNVTGVFNSSYRGYGFKNGNIEVSITLDQLLNLKVLGELQGQEAWVSLLNKVNYVD